MESKAEMHTHKKRILLIRNKIMKCVNAILIIWPRGPNPIILIPSSKGEPTH